MSHVMKVSGGCLNFRQSWIQGPGGVGRGRYFQASVSLQFPVLASFSVGCLLGWLLVAAGSCRSLAKESMSSVGQQKSQRGFSEDRSHTTVPEPVTGLERDNADEPAWVTWPLSQGTEVGETIPAAVEIMSPPL